MTLLSIVDRQRLSDVAFDRLTEAVIRGDIAPGEKIRDADLAQRLGLSRTPVREAVARLIEIGLAEAKPGVHTRVSLLTRENVAMTLAVLKPLDELAVRTAVPNLTTRDFERMRLLNKKFARAVEEYDLNTALEADDEFHRLVREASHNPVLMRVISQLDPHVQRILHHKFSTMLGSENTMHHHDQLIDLFEARDAQAAAALSGEQWSVLGGQIAELFDSENG